MGGCAGIAGALFTPHATKQGCLLFKMFLLKCKIKPKRERGEGGGHVKNAITSVESNRRQADLVRHSHTHTHTMLCVCACACVRKRKQTESFFAFSFSFFSLHLCHFAENVGA